MATSYKTPGVFVEEIPKFPPSIAEVETAIPAFVGYTQMASNAGESLLNKPVKISSLLEYTTYYGGPHAPDHIDVTVDPGNNYAVTNVAIDTGKLFYLYDSVRMFYDNGGGDCYIVSVGNYYNSSNALNAVASGNEADAVNFPGLRVGLAAVEKEDEPTILLFPDAVMLPGSEFYGLQQMAIAQAAKLQDRVALLDLRENGFSNFNDAVKDFRDNIGINNLKYAMAYGPWLYSSFAKDVAFETFGNFVKDGSSNPINLGVVSSDVAANQLIADLNNAMLDVGALTATINTYLNANASGVLGANTTPSTPIVVRDKMKSYVAAISAASTDALAKTALTSLADYVNNVATNLQTVLTGATYFKSQQMVNDVKSYAQSDSLWRGGAKKVLGVTTNAGVLGFTGEAIATLRSNYAIAGNLWLGVDPTVILPSPTVPADPKVYTGGTDKIKAQLMANDIAAAFEKIALFIDTIVASAASYKKAAQDSLYNLHPVVSNIVKSIKREMAKLPPSGAIAGIYARVDAAKGVWKAPANESINSITGPVYAISADEQASLNVDTQAGKSVNAIRTFTGKGTLVWGARTLAGNDNEWRYVSVRRFFNMVEESSRKATESFVFEANDANTWVKVQGMIENFLTTLRRAGALQGAKAEHAFYVSVGLGKTMTALDILEGRMIVEIGMAVVRPAEFIILRFSHKMAES